ncbi:MAG: hypothetical protein QW372_05665 [Nitrososphaerales archaeon]
MNLKNIDKLDTIFITLIISISFLPLIPLSGWQRYGPAGEYSYTSELFYMRYNDPTFGNDKPHIFVKNHGIDTSLIELSDHESAIDGKNVYKNFSTITRLINGILIINYSSSDLKFIKRVQPDNDIIKINYEFPRDVIAELTFWRWYFRTIESFDRPITRIIEPKDTLHFTFSDGNCLYHAYLKITPTPKNITISGEENGGLNRIMVIIKAKMIQIDIKLLSKEDISKITIPQLWGSRYLYPIIGISLSIVYIKAKKSIIF